MSGAGSSGSDGGSGGFQGWQGVTDANSDHNFINFMTRQIMGRASSVKLVKIMAIRNGGAGALAKAGIVDVQPLTNQADGIGTSMPHGTVYGLIYFRMQGGTSAVIMDPVVGDIGFALVCDRDISTNKAQGGQANPGSNRRFDLADGIYIGGVMNTVPTQFIQFLASGGITITDANGNVVKLQPGEPAITVTPASGQHIYLGGDPAQGGTYDFVKTVTSVAMNVKARIS